MWTPVVVGTAATVAAVPLYIVLQNTFGLEGVALASTLALAIYTGILAAVWYGEDDGRWRLRRLAAETGLAVPLTTIGGFAAFGVAYGISQLVDFGTIGSALTTVVSVGIVLIGTAVFVAVALLLGSLLHDWLLPKPAEDTDPETAEEETEEPATETQLEPSPDQS
jgi:peptidoglycan biosynthesis protein MviN/MurJ (putative lipid II flippase)